MSQLLSALAAYVFCAISLTTVGNDLQGWRQGVPEWQVDQPITSLIEEQLYHYYDRQKEKTNE